MKLFKLYNKEPNAIVFGKLYVADLPVPYDTKPRTIRVFIPNNFNNNENKPNNEQ